MMSKVTVVIKKTVREEYSECKQGMLENIFNYKKCFDARLDALTTSGNTPPANASNASNAKDFMYGLDNSRYSEFKAEIINDMQKGTTLNLDDINKMHILTSRRVVIKASKDGGGGATFATIDKSQGQEQHTNKKESENNQGTA